MPRHAKGSIFDAKRIFAQRLKSWRETEHLSLKIIAVELGVTESAFSQWENGITFPSARNFALLANYTGLPPCYFLCLGRENCQQPCEPAPEHLK